MTSEETIKLDNFKAHYGVILNNIRIANDSLSSILIQEDAAKGRIGSLLKSEREATTRLVALTQREAEINANLVSRENSLNLRDENLKKEEGSLLARQTEFAQELIDKPKELEVELQRIKDLILIEQKSLDNVKELIKAEDDRLAKLVLDVKTITKELTDARLALSAIINELDSFTSNANTTKINLNAEIKTLTEERDALLKSLATPVKILEDREAAVALRERDVQVWVRRIAKKIKLLWPDSKIEI